MPKVIFKYLWDAIKSRKNIYVFIKNLRKDGRYYWIVTDFETIVDKKTDEITGYYAYRQAAPREALKEISALYQKLLAIEKKFGLSRSEKYFREFLENKNMS